MQTLKTSKAKENILKKIREGLKETLPMPFPEVDKTPIEHLYPKSDKSLEETFAESFIRIGGKFVFCMEEAEVVNGLIALKEQMGWNELLCADDNWLVQLNSTSAGVAMPANGKNETANASITTCEYLVARTGSCILTSAQNNGRTAPVFYPVHIIIAHASQIVADLPDAISALTRKYGAASLPSMINLNTGASRTADIEKTLVVGVHGPGEVFCFLLP